MGTQRTPLSRARSGMLLLPTPLKIFTIFQDKSVDNVPSGIRVIK